MKLLKLCWTENSAQDLVEYGLIALLISASLIAMVQATGNPVLKAWQYIDSVVQNLP